MIAVSGLCKSYGSKTVVSDVSFTLPRGGITSIVGPNGAGKSTLLSMMGRLLPMDGGSVHVGGLDIAHTPNRALAKRLAILRQENRFPGRLTVRDLVSFGRYPHSHGRLDRQDREQVDMALAFTGLERLADRFTDELSGGQRQRACIAMVLAQDTDYILLDEPLNSLDMRHSVSMMKQLRHAADELGRTIVLVIHDINFAAAYSDRILAMKDGQLVHDGTPGEFMTPTALQAVFDTAVHVEHVLGQPVGIYYR